MGVVAELVKQFELLPHPEGGYYRETYRSSEQISSAALPTRFGGDRNMGTAIYFLLEKGNFSAFHRIKSDECWHFYLGDALYVHVLHPDGHYERIVMGNDYHKGQQFQALVPAGCWFASETAEGGTYSFTGCTVAPGFDFADFELAKVDELSAQYPEHTALIERLCRI